MGGGNYWRQDRRRYWSTRRTARGREAEEGVNELERARRRPAGESEFFQLFDEDGEAFAAVEVGETLFFGGGCDDL